MKLFSSLPFRFLILFPLLLLAPASSAKADTSPPPDYLSAALELWQIVTPEPDKLLFDHMEFQAVRGENAPLARYHPDDEENGHIEVGQNLRQYRREYIYFSSDLDVTFKPDFDQYMAVMSALSLANESAHLKQHHNGSLEDFYQFHRNGKLGKACALYSLQQYVSDMVMLDFAQRTELFFLGQGSVKGMNALRLALEKNDLREEYEFYREAKKSGSGKELDTIRQKIRQKREKANMSGLDFCGKQSGQADLPQDIIQRAFSPLH